MATLVPCFCPASGDMCATVQACAPLFVYAFRISYFEPISKQLFFVVVVFISASVFNYRVTTIDRIFSYNNTRFVFVALRSTPRAGRFLKKPLNEITLIENILSTVSIPH